MQAKELIFHSIWSGVIAVLILTTPEHSFNPGGWRVPIGLVLLAPSIITVVALTAISNWFQRLIGRNRKPAENRASKSQ